MAYSGYEIGILSDLAAVYKTLGLETMVTIISEMGKVSTHLMVAVVLLTISIVLASSDNLSDRQVIKKEIFIQKLAAKMDTQIRWVERSLKSYSVSRNFYHFSARSKREIISIHSPSLPPNPHA